MNELLDAQSEKIEKQLITAYSRNAKSIIQEAEKLYLEIMEEGHVVTYAEMMRYDRYFKLLASINQKLKKMGAKQIQILDVGMLDLYKKNYVTIKPEFTQVNEFQAREVIKRVWCADGKTYSDRVWDNMNLLQTTLQTALVDCVVQGKSHKHLENELRHRFNVSQSAANRLARTELNYVQNQAALQAYIDAGYTHYKFITAIDGRQCDECGKLNGKVFAIAEAEVGVNLPPIHSNCRSNIIGYKED